MPDSSRSKRTVHLHHEPGAPEPVGRALKTEKELRRLIEGAGKADLTEIQSVVRKMQVVIADYLESGKALKITLRPVEILSAIEAALEEADGRPSPWPDGADVRTFFIHGLYDEIVQQPSNIFETRLFPDGSERYVPVSKAAWKACLQEIRDRLREAVAKNLPTEEDVT